MFDILPNYKTFRYLYKITVLNCFLKKQNKKKKNKHKKNKTKKTKKQKNIELRGEFTFSPRYF